MDLDDMLDNVFQSVVSIDNDFMNAPSMRPGNDEMAIVAASLQDLDLTPTKAPPASKQSTPTQQPNQKQQLQRLKDIFPAWDDEALRDILGSCEGNEEMAVAMIFEWSSTEEGPTPSSSSSSSSFSSSPASAEAEELSKVVLEVLPREPYDKFMRTHVLRLQNSSTQKITLAAVSKFTARARLAKEVVAKRKEVLKDCESRSAPVLKGPSEVEREKEKIQSAMSREDKILDGKRLMDERLAFLSLQMVTMVDDGNCQFRALSHELYGTQSHHAVVRAKCLAYLASHAEDYAMFVGDEQDWTLYLSKMREVKTWGDELTLIAASKIFDVNVHVVSTEKEHWLLHYGESGDKNNKRDLFLAYISPIHYNVVSPKA